MEIYNKEKTEIIQNPNLELGYLMDDTKITYLPKVDPVEEVGHYETIAKYDNGGEDVEYIVDIPASEGREASIITEQIKVYIPYTEDELNEINKKKQISQLENDIENVKHKLSESDYKVIKRMEGYYTDDEWNEIIDIRESLRNIIRTKQEELIELTKGEVLNGE